MKNMKVSKSSGTSRTGFRIEIGDVLRNRPFRWLRGSSGTSGAGSKTSRIARKSTKSWKIWKSPNLLGRPELVSESKSELFCAIDPSAGSAVVAEPAEPAPKPVASHENRLSHEKYESLQIFWDLQNWFQNRNRSCFAKSTLPLAQRF